MAWRPGDDDGVAVRRAKVCLQSNLAAMRGEPSGASLQVLAMLRLGGNAGKADVVAEFTDESGLVLVEIVNDRLHGELCSKREGKKQRRTDCNPIEGVYEQAVRVDF